MNIYAYILVMAAVSYLLRVLPLTLIRRPIKNRFIRSFLYYVPYVTLAVMTFPAMVNEAASPLSGIIALIAGILLAWIGANMFTVAISCCGIVFILELILTHLS
ncbi:MAG: AzlD domain-containing protein [Lachnospiraceae bacterium]|nr:AzlD domain-containing protein [Lachnospiraceae bacterium]